MLQFNEEGYSYNLIRLNATAVEYPSGHEPLHGDYNASAGDHNASTDNDREPDRIAQSSSLVATPSLLPPSMISVVESALVRGPNTAMNWILRKLNMAMTKTKEVSSGWVLFKTLVGP